MGCAALKDFPSCQVEVKTLLLAATGIKEETLFSHPEWIPSLSSQEKFFHFISQRKKGYPLSYLTGIKEFWSIPFMVGEGVLIPRPETEMLVEKTLENLNQDKLFIADIGTGCGNIAISLAKELPQSKILAVDISDKALFWAKLNSRKLKVNNVSFLLGDLFSPLKENKMENGLDCIVSNPPYVSSSEWYTLSPEICNYEPPEALIGGNNGLEIIKRLIQEAPSYLKKSGILIFEIGWQQKNRVEKMLQSAWEKVEFFSDLSGIDRICFARKK